MIRLFLLIGIVGGGAILWLATFGMGPEMQQPPAVSQLEKFRAAGLLPPPEALSENEEMEHGIFELPPEDEERLEALLAEGGMAGMKMDGTEKMPSDAGDAMEMPGTGEAMKMPEEEEAGMAAAAGLVIVEDDGGPVDREIELVMSEWKFSDMNIEVKPGERIRFRVRNGGEIPHEFMFMTMPAMQAVSYRATRADWSLYEHEALFEQSLVLPDGGFSFVVEVTKPGSWMFMCMLPYHMQMGMMGQMATPGAAMQM